MEAIATSTLRKVAHHCGLTALALLAPALLASASAHGLFPPAAAASQNSPVAQGAGSTFVQPLLTAWAAVYKDETNQDIEYRPIGSGAGLDETTAGTADFSATDQPLTSQELAKANLVQFPIAFGAIVPVVNIAGIKPGQLRVTGSLLADIFSAKVTSWDDPAIKKLNPDLKLPNARISIVHRSDSSGTTFNFTHYLSQVSPAWKSSIGEGKIVKWPTSIGAEGNGAIADWVQRIPNSIGYAEYAYVMTHDLTYACVENSSGKFICPNAETLASALQRTDWNAGGDFYVVPTNAKGLNSYPIIGATFIVMPRQEKDKERSDAALKFFRYDLEKGQVEAGALNYAPLPDDLVAKIEAYLRARH